MSPIVQKFRPIPTRSGKTGVVTLPRPSSAVCELERALAEIHRNDFRRDFPICLAVDTRRSSRGPRTCPGFRGPSMRYGSILGCCMLLRSMKMGICAPSLLRGRAGTRAAAKLLTRDEARRIAANIGQRALRHRKLPAASLAWRGASYGWRTVWRREPICPLRGAPWGGLGRQARG